MNIKLTDIKIPGVLWVLLVCVVVVGLEYAGVDASITAIGVTAVFAVAKFLNVGTADVDQLLALLREVSALLPTRRGSTKTFAKEIADAEPNHLVRWLVG